MERKKAERIILVMMLIGIIISIIAAAVLIFYESRFIKEAEDLQQQFLELQQEIDRIISDTDNSPYENEAARVIVRYT